MEPPRLASIAALSVLFAAAASAASGWTGASVERFGVEIAYPSEIFAPVQEENPGVRGFASEDGRAKFVFGAWRNDKGETPPEMRAFLTTQGERYADVTYAPEGRSWFVLSGYRGDDIYYEKIMFTCGRRLVNVYAISYPAAQRDIYDPVVERMENSFRPGHNCR